MAGKRGERYELPAALVEALGDNDAELELHCISFSHYCARARWALELCGVKFDEVGYLPVQHIFPLVSLRRRFPATPIAKTASSQSPAATPLLAVWRRTAGGERVPVGVVSNSALIARFAALRAAARGDARPSRALYGCDLRLEPAPAKDGGADSSSKYSVVVGDGGDAYERIAALELRLSGALGVESRRVAYHYLLPSASLGGALFVKNSSGSSSSLVARFWYWVCRLVLRRLLGVSAATAAKGEARLCEEFDHLDGLVAAGELPDAASLSSSSAASIPNAALVSLATLAGPMLAPEPLPPGLWMPGLGEVPPPLRALMERLRARPAGKLALRLWELHYGGAGGGAKA